MSTIKSYRSPLARVRGQGAGGGVTSHFIAQRMTAAALLFLAPWFAAAAAFGIRTHGDALAFVRHPLNSAGLVLLILVGAAHMKLGMQVIIEDYVAGHGVRSLLLLANTFTCAGLAFAGVWAVLQINFGW